MLTRRPYAGRARRPRSKLERLRELSARAKGWAGAASADQLSIRTTAKTGPPSLLTANTFSIPTLCARRACRSTSVRRRHRPIRHLPSGGLRRGRMTRYGEKRCPTFDGKRCPREEGFTPPAGPAGSCPGRPPPHALHVSLATFLEFACPPVTAGELALEADNNGRSRRDKMNGRDTDRAPPPTGTLKRALTVECLRTSPTFSRR